MRPQPSSVQLGRPVLPAFVDAAELGGGGQGKSAASCRSDGHIGRLVSSAPDIISGTAHG